MCSLEDIKQKLSLINSAINVFHTTTGMDDMNDEICILTNEDDLNKLEKNLADEKIMERMVSLLQKYLLLILYIILFEHDR